MQTNKVFEAKSFNAIIGASGSGKSTILNIIGTLDQPTGNLDSESSENICKILRNINEELKTTFVIITHDKRIAEKTDRIVEIKDGRIS